MLKVFFFCILHAKIQKIILCFIDEISATDFQKKWIKFVAKSHEINPHRNRKFKVGWRRYVWRGAQSDVVESLTRR